MLKKAHLGIIFSLLTAIIISPLIFVNIQNFFYSVQTGVPSKTTPESLRGFVRFNSPSPEFKELTYTEDFKPVYVASKKFINFNNPNIYNKEIFGCPHQNRYPPLLYFLYNKTFCNFSFPTATLLHLFSQILLLVLASFYILCYYNLAIMIIPVTVIYCAVLFLTPIGLFWLERGQFDIYVALSIMFFLFAAIESKSPFFALSAIFMSLKPTIFPFYIQAFIVYLAFNWNLEKLKHLAIFISLILVTLIIFPNCWMPYLLSCIDYQTNYSSHITLIKTFPALLLTFLLAINLTAYLTSLFVNRNKNILQNTFLPYMSSICVLSLSLASINFEYRIIALLGFIPMIFVWLIKIHNDQSYKIEFSIFFLLLIYVEFHGYWNFTTWLPSDDIIITTYLAYYLTVSLISIANNFSAFHTEEKSI
ncbi:MAG: hypothetical protein HQL22_04960 [Candidatus Omnitrophica bacterium]|nr:hypothetical protein [Candidatus Omnitrophota bacterium]